MLFLFPLKGGVYLPCSLPNLRLCLFTPRATAFFFGTRISMMLSIPPPCGCRPTVSTPPHSRGITLFYYLSGSWTGDYPMRNELNFTIRFMVPSKKRHFTTAQRFEAKFPLTNEDVFANRNRGAAEIQPAVCFFPQPRVPPSISVDVNYSV